MNLMGQLYFSFLLLSQLLFIVCFAVDWEKNAVLMLGNVGAGKSLLANILLKNNRFVSKFQVKAVTTYFEEDHIVENGKELIVLDIPGVLDINPEVQKQNIKQLQNAFKQHHKQIVMFVFNVFAGRISPTDLSTFLALFRAYEFNQQSIIFVLNGLTNEIYRNEEKKRGYIDQVYDCISTNLLERSLWSIDVPINIVVVPQFDESKDGSFSHTSDQVVSVRQKLIEAIDGSAYHQHFESNGLDVTDETIEKEIERSKLIGEEIERRRKVDEFYSNITSSVFYPAIAYGKVWGDSFNTDPYRTWSIKDRTDALMNRMCAQNALAGFVGGLASQAGTVLSMGFVIPLAVTAAMIASVAATVSLQVAFASAVATLYGKDPHSPIVQLQILNVMLGGGLVELFKQQYGPAGAKLLEQMIRANVVTGANVRWLNAMIFKLMPSLGRYFFVIEGARRGVFRVADLLPLIGPLMSGALDGAFCLANARGMDFAFFQKEVASKAKEEL